MHGRAPDSASPPPESIPGASSAQQQPSRSIIVHPPLNPPRNRYTGHRRSPATEADRTRAKSTAFPPKPTTSLRPTAALPAPRTLLRQRSARLPMRTRRPRTLGTGPPSPNAPVSPASFRRRDHRCPPPARTRPVPPHTGHVNPVPAARSNPPQPGHRSVRVAPSRRPPRLPYVAVTAPSGPFRPPPAPATPTGSAPPPPTATSPDEQPASACVAPAPWADTASASPTA